MQKYFKVLIAISSLVFINSCSMYYPGKFTQKTINYPQSMSSDAKNGWNYLYSGNAADAKKILLKALKKNDNDFYAHWGLGGVLMSEKKYAKALVHLNKADQLSPNNIKIMNAIACVYLNKGQYENNSELYKQALKIIARAEKLNPSYGLTYINKALAFALLGKIAEAKATYEIAKKNGARTNPQTMKIIFGNK